MSKRSMIRVALAPALALLGLLAFAVPAAAYPPGVGSAETLSASTVAPGGCLTVGLSSFHANSTATITFDRATPLASGVPLDASGNGSARVCIPSSATAGTHQICSTDAQGLTQCSSVTVLAAPAAGGGGGGLAATGVAVLTIAGLGVLLLIGGGLMLFAGKRRRAIV